MMPASFRAAARNFALLNLGYFRIEFAAALNADAARAVYAAARAEHADARP